MTALVVIDVQQGAFNGDWAMPAAEQAALITACQQAIAWARAAGHTVLWVQHHEPGGPMDGAGFAIDPRLAPADTEARLLKTEPSAFQNAATAALLAGHERILLCGLQSECCVRATALAGHALGLPVAVIGDAHHTWPGEGRSAAEIRDAVNTELATAGIPLQLLTDLR